MKYAILSIGGVAPNVIMEIAVDTEQDRQNLSVTNMQAGCRVFVIETSQWYMLNNQKAWVPVVWNGIPVTRTVVDGGNSGG